MKVSALLEALPKVGKVKAQEIMTELEIAPTRRLRGLGDRQRKALLEKFDSVIPGASVSAGRGAGRVRVVSVRSVCRREVDSRPLSARPDSRSALQRFRDHQGARPGEVDGVDYSFVTAERFQDLIDARPPPRVGRYPRRTAPLRHPCPARSRRHRRWSPGADRSRPGRGARRQESHAGSPHGVPRARPTGKRWRAGCPAAAPKPPRRWPAASPLRATNSPPKTTSTSSL